MLELVHDQIQVVGPELGRERHFVLGPFLTLDDRHFAAGIVKTYGARQGVGGQLVGLERLYACAARP